MKRIPALVSVIIPCYNHGKFLHEAIKSILNQTYRNFEIIIVDDGSDDKETLDILEKIDIQGVEVFHKRNGDVASARNYGIRRSCGEYILTLDSDDKFAPTFIEKSVDILQKQPKVGMVTSYVLRFGENAIVSGKLECKGGDIKDFLLKNQAVACLMFRFQCWKDAGGYDEEIQGFEDWEFAISVTKQGWTVYSIPEYLFFYRRVPGSMYKRVLDKRPEIMKYIVMKHAEIFQRHAEDVIYERELQIKQLRQTLEVYQDSTTVKIGNLLLKPLRWVNKLVKERNKTNSYTLITAKDISV